jgi:hypothetical protein
MSDTKSFPSNIFMSLTNSHVRSMSMFMSMSLCESMSVSVFILIFMLMFMLHEHKTGLH